MGLIVTASVWDSGYRMMVEEDVLEWKLDRFASWIKGATEEGFGRRLDISNGTITVIGGYSHQDHTEWEILCDEADREEVIATLHAACTRSSSTLQRKLV